jgi:regulator of sirC expression with transglutaminase-like and TPR domain
LRLRLSAHDSDTSRVVALSQFFGADLGFRGNADDYYNARNSLLPCVIDTRLGIPISLSVLYMIVARRASIVVDGINLPGHFVVRHGAVLFDPFEGGRILSTRDCAEILSKQSLSFHPSHLQVAHPKLILVRMLSNLLYVFELEDDEALHGMVTKWIHLLDPT